MNTCTLLVKLLPLQVPVASGATQVNVCVSLNLSAMNLFSSPLSVPSSHLPQCSVVLHVSFSSSSPSPPRLSHLVTLLQSVCLDHSSPSSDSCASSSSFLASSGGKHAPLLMLLLTLFLLPRSSCSSSLSGRESLDLSSLPLTSHSTHGGAAACVPQRWDGADGRNEHAGVVG